jgi:PAS domain S-box-containing protein
MRQPSPGRQKLILWIAFIVIVLASASAFYSTLRLIAASERVARTQTMLIETNRFLSEIAAVESSSRGFFVTGDDRYLKVRSANFVSAKATAARILALQTSGELRQRLERLVALAEDRLRYSNRVVSLRGSPSEALRNIRLGSDVMDQVRSDAETIIAAQTNAYRSEQRQLERESWLIGLALAVGVMLSLGMIGWLFTLRGREVEARRQLAEELRALNIELDTRVTERTAQLRNSEERAGLVIDTALDAVVSMNQGGAITDWNPQAERIFGWTRDEALGRPVDETIMPERYRQAHRAGLARYLSTGKARVLNRRIELAALRRSGKEFPIELAITPICQGDTVSFSAFIRDLTDTKTRDEQLRQLQRMDATGRLTGGIAHDFNNLLAIIHGNSELIRDKVEDETETAEMVDDVINAADRGAELVRRLLAFARMQHLEPEPVDLNARLPNILGLLQRSLSERVEVRVKSAKKLWPAIVDPTQVDDAIVNLAINARDAMPDGGTLTIETRNVHLDEEYASHHVEVTPGEYVMLAVSDTGTGMSPEVVSRAFEPFFTTKEEGKGTGLGLSQVFGWVKQSGGHIKIYSEFGHGTTIKLYLPRASSYGGEKTAEPEAAIPRGDETIFVVEDNPNVRKTVIRQLHDLGYKTVEADSGVLALQLVEQGTEFDLLLTDIVMLGGITGYQLAEQLQQRRPDIKILFTSGYTELTVQPDGPPNRHSLLSKPYRKQDLARAVRRALDAP